MTLSRGGVLPAGPDCDRAPAARTARCRIPRVSRKLNGDRCFGLGVGFVFESPQSRVIVVIGLRPRKQTSGEGEIGLGPPRVSVTSCASATTPRKFNTCATALGSFRIPVLRVATDELHPGCRPPGWRSGRPLTGWPLIEQSRRIPGQQTDPDREDQRPLLYMLQHPRQVLRFGDEKIRA